MIYDGFPLVGFQLIQLIHHVLDQIEIGRTAGDQQTVGATVDRDRQLLTWIRNRGQFRTRHHALRTRNGRQTIRNLRVGTAWLEHQQVFAFIETEEIDQDFPHRQCVCVLELEDPDVLGALRGVVQILDHSADQID